MRSFSDTDFDPTSSRLLKLLCVKKLLKSPFQINRRSCYNRLFGLVDEFFSVCSLGVKQTAKCGVK